MMVNGFHTDKASRKKLSFIFFIDDKYTYIPDKKIGLKRPILCASMLIRISQQMLHQHLPAPALLLLRLIYNEH